MYGHRKEHVTIFLFPNKQKIHVYSAQEDTKSDFIDFNSR
jgi:hypothetical protein